MTIQLRAVEDTDLDLFFQHSQDPAAIHMAAFTREDPSNRHAFDAHWNRIRTNPAVQMMTVVADGQVVGNMGSFVMFDQLQVTYWIDRTHWGRGIATQALKAFLDVQTTRPIYARAAADNAGSLRVLEKCGFRPHATERGHAAGRGCEIEEAVMVLA